MKALTGFSHVYRPYDLNTVFLSQGCTLGQLLGEGKANSMHIPREPLIAWDQLVGQLLLMSSQ